MENSPKPQYKKITHYRNIYIRRLPEYEKFFNVCGKFQIWLVDGSRVRRRWNKDFVSGGNSKRFTFVPADEIWIDSEFSLAEAVYTVRHELHEQELMAQGMNYDDAHDLALAQEDPMRESDEKDAEERSANAKPTAPYAYEVYDPKEPFPWEKKEEKPPPDASS